MFNGKQYGSDEANAFMVLRPYFRFCPSCGEQLETECSAHDPCIRNCKGTDDACCGHGVLDAAYVTVGDRTVLKGQAAQDYFKANCG